MHGYWAARGLAERGHKVFVVTNADEVEDTFRIRIPNEDLGPDGAYAPRFEHGKVEVLSTTRPDRNELYYIPMGNPTVSRLAAIATDVIRENHCEVIYSYYLEPYGVAAHLASYWTGIPYVFKHAGSDLYRLMPIEDLTSGYREVLARANRIISRGPSRKQLVSHGITQSRIESKVAFGLPRKIFNSSRTPLDINSLLNEEFSDLSKTSVETNFSSPLNPEWPVLGIYGKLGEPKGSFDLLNALALLVDDGFPVQLVALSRGWQERRFHQLIDELGLKPYVRVRSFIPHWQIPAFIQACQAIAFLERDFAITAHTPTIPTEILSCGGCLILSEEVLRKQLFRNQVRDRKNLIVVSDPKNHKELADAIRYALEDSVRASAIAKAGEALVSDSHGYNSYIGELESLLGRVAKEEPVGSCLAVTDDLLTSPRDPNEMLESMFPYLGAILSPRTKEHIKRAMQGSGLGSDTEERSGLAREFGEILLSVIKEDEVASPLLLSDLCCYEMKLHEWAGSSQTSPASVEAPTGRLPSDLGLLMPMFVGDWEVHEFSYDVEQLARGIDDGSYLQGRIPSDEEAQATLLGPLFVLFRRGSIPLRVNLPTVILLAFIQKAEGTVEELVYQVKEQLSGTVNIPHLQLEKDILSVLEGLYWEGAIQFQKRLELTG